MEQRTELCGRIQRLCAAFGCSGREGPVREALLRELPDWVHEGDVMTGPLGGLTVRIGTEGGRRIMLDAHMDTIGFCVTEAGADGRMRFRGVGYVIPQRLPGTEVVFEDGCSGVIRSDGGTDSPGLGELYIEKCGGAARTGEFFCYRPSFSEDGALITGTYLDDRAGCAALLAAMRELKDSPCEVYCSFSVQEEVGMRGVVHAAELADPEEAYVIDLGVAGDMPGAAMNRHVSLGGGVIEKIMDDSIVCHPQALCRLEAAARRAGVPLMRTVGGAGYTNAGGLHTACQGIPTAILAIPARNIHTPGETVHMGDVEACAALLAELGRGGKEHEQ